MKINEIIKSLRRSKNITQSEAAKLLGISLSSYQKYERNKNSVNPSLEVLIKLADLYHVTVDYIIGRKAAKPEPLDDLENEFAMTALEKKILSNYFSLSKYARADLMEFLRKSIKDIENQE